YLMRSFVEQTLLSYLLAGGLLLLGIFQFWVAVQLRNLSPSAKIPAVFLSSIGLIGFPVGTIINAYILYVLLCKKGRYVLSPEYQEIVRATPDIRYHTSIIIWIVLAIFILMIAAAIIIPMLY
ncbi:MAG: hypothetical protein JRI86_14770, partial [Deltaproteobacteria bacterium]|nr:hypothetical protein [Deltaproteobacteria bacterium]